jgi:V8-like Glu-specific endopeptidase
MRRALVCTIAVAINASASALAQSTGPLQSPNQHYGEIADPSVWPISAVGVVTVALFSHKMNCTGTLVAPKLVLTGAHCLFNGKLLVNDCTKEYLRHMRTQSVLSSQRNFRDRLYLPSIVRDCSVSESPDNRLFNHKCLTNFGYSGAPLLAQIGGTTAVIGINSVGNPEQRTGMACSATQFAKAVAELTQSE